MTTTPPVTPEDEFAAAFAELNTPGGAPADPPAEDPPAEDPPADPPPVADPPVDPPPAADPPADPPAPVDPPPAPAPVAETEEQIRARIRAELEAELAKQAPAPAPAPAEDPPPAKKLYSPEEEASLAKYQEDWPDIAKHEKLLRRAEYNDVINHVFSQLRPIIEEMQSKMSSYGKRTLYDDLVDMVPDYDDVRDKALAWIDTQPEYLKNAYRHVADNGTAEEVADLINRYKRETNYQAPAAAPAATPPAAPAAPATPPPAVPPAAAAAAAALAPVGSSRSEPPKPGPDANDFDAAFAEFAKMGRK